MKSTRNYQNTDVYVGIDVHKKSYAIAASISGEIILKLTSPANGSSLAESLKRLFKGARIHSVYEAGFSGFGLHRTLIESGIDNIIVNPASIEVAANDKKKTDKRDAKKMSIQLGAKRLKGIYIPSIEEELRRQVTRTREQIVKEKNRVAHRIKSKLLYFGYIEPEDDRELNGLFLKWVESLDLQKELRLSLDILTSQYKLFTKQLGDLKIEMQEQVFEDPVGEEIYRSVPGIGPISARVLSNELGDIAKRFHSQKALYQYTGLTPSEHSSGENICRGQIDRQGSSRIRGLLVEVAWRAVQNDEALKLCFNKIACRRGKKRAIVAIARKLIGRIRACFVHNELYTIGLVA